MFLASMLLIVVGGLLMEAFIAPGQFGFIIGLFIVMGGVILFAISLNYGSPPDTRPLPPVEHGAATPTTSGAAH